MYHYCHEMHFLIISLKYCFLKSCSGSLSNLPHVHCCISHVSGSGHGRKELRETRLPTAQSIPWSAISANRGHPWVIRWFYLRAILTFDMIRDQMSTTFAPVCNEWGGTEEQEYGEHWPAEVVGSGTAIVIGAEDAAVVQVPDPVVHQVRILVRRDGRVLRVAS